MKAKTYTLRKFTLALTLLICLLLIIISLGCNPKYIVIVHNLSNDACYTLTTKKGEKITWEMIYKEYPEDFKFDTGFHRDNHFYTDTECRNKFVGGIYNNIDLYYKEYSPEYYAKVSFEYKDVEYIIFREYGKKLIAEDFTRSAYGYGKPEDYAFYSDKELVSPLNIETVELDEDIWEIKIYVADAK